MLTIPLIHFIMVKIIIVGSKLQLLTALDKLVKLEDKIKSGLVSFETISQEIGSVKVNLA